MDTESSRPEAGPLGEVQLGSPRPGWPPPSPGVAPLFYRAQTHQLKHTLRKKGSHGFVPRDDVQQGYGVGRCRLQEFCSKPPGLTLPPPCPPHCHLEERPLIARWKTTNESVKDLRDSADGPKGLP